MSYVECHNLAKNILNIESADNLLNRTGRVFPRQTGSNTSKFYGSSGRVEVSSGKGTGFRRNGIWCEIPSCSRLLRVKDPWDVTESKLDLERKRVVVRLERRALAAARNALENVPSKTTASASGVTLTFAAISSTYMRSCLALSVPNMARRRSRFRGRPGKYAVNLAVHY